jgi:hypothetical protein
VKRVLAESIDVGDGFECLHGFLLMTGTKKPAGGAGTRGRCLTLKLGTKNVYIEVFVPRAGSTIK